MNCTTGQRREGFFYASWFSANWSSFFGAISVEPSNICFKEVVPGQNALPLNQIQPAKRSMAVGLPMIALI